ncbi:MAG: peptide deformylase [Phycisphaerales bacterium]|nr:MAG: peptide deformylase [Phycisphaerales bacterium]
MPVDPSTLYVVHYPAAILRAKASDVPSITDEVRWVAARMIDLMREEEGIGLAAPQVGLSWRMFVVEIPEDDGRSASGEPMTATKGPVVYINPVLSEAGGLLESKEEGCLSLPDIRGPVQRPALITVRARGLDGTEFTQHAGGLLARCLQHENDHLDGALIIDKMPQIHRLKNRSAIRALEREAAQ